MLPPDHNVVGTCGHCGGPILSPIITWASSGATSPRPEHCLDCGKSPKPIVSPAWGPIREMSN